MRACVVLLIAFLLSACASDLQRLLGCQRGPQAGLFAGHVASPWVMRASSMDARSRKASACAGSAAAWRSHRLRSARAWSLKRAMPR